MGPKQEDLDRYRDNYLMEKEGAALYKVLARAETNPGRADIFRKLAATEERHCQRWLALIEAAGAPAPKYESSWRVRVLGFLARRVGTGYVLPVVGNLEARGQDVYTGQAEAGVLPAEERSHRRTLEAMGDSKRKGADAILSSERWHRHTYGGSLRAAVFGINDGLISNLSLVMGVAGAGSESRFVLIAGIAGLMAGAFSMAAGEYVSVKSQIELYERQIALEQQELEMSPAEERDELTLIYQAKGIPRDQAAALAEHIISDPAQAIQTLAREELGLDPASLGSPQGAALSSFLAFTVGAFVPILPYLLTDGRLAVSASAVLSAAALFGAGFLISIFTGRNAIFSGTRMLIIGSLAAALTYTIGRVLDVTL